MKTREKLAACLGEHFHQSAYAGRTLDALEAIVQEARDEAIEECAVLSLKRQMYPGLKLNDTRADRHDDTLRSLAKELRSLKKAKP